MKTIKQVDFNQVVICLGEIGQTLCPYNGLVEIIAHRLDINHDESQIVVNTLIDLKWLEWNSNRLFLKLNHEKLIK